ncbi:uncharacterized protein AAES06_008404 isoform 2-T3 [Glossophaga mutica]
MLRRARKAVSIDFVQEKKKDRRLSPWQELRRRGKERYLFVGGKGLPTEAQIRPGVDWSENRIHPVSFHPQQLGVSKSQQPGIPVAKEKGRAVRERS